MHLPIKSTLKGNTFIMFFFRFWVTRALILDYRQEPKELTGSCRINRLTNVSNSVTARGEDTDKRWEGVVS